MSHRAIQRLRRERDAEQMASAEDDDDDSDDEDEAPPKKSNVFAAGMFDDSDSSSSESEDSDDDSENDNESAEDNDHAKTKESRPPQAKEEQPSEVEDLDALLEEYKLQDEGQEETTTTVEGEPGPSYYDAIASNMELRDLDIEAVRRSLFGGIDGGGGGGPAGRRTQRQLNVFGIPSDNWPRPPHYVGGGIGMKTYSDDTKTSQRSLPWPYCDMKEGDPRCPPPQNWFRFDYSDSYQRDCQDMKTIVASGDPNALALFIAHHPFVVEALLQLSIVMYQMNQSREGLAFLKRALYALECAAPNTFLRVAERCALMDCEMHANKPFFSALFRLMRVAYVGGLPRTSLAASRFILSLDPLRDPMNALLCIDHFALQCNTESCNRWLVDFVESETVCIVHRDENGDEFECKLLDLPNWSFSYALALFTLHEESSSASGEEIFKAKADEALRTAIGRFPSIIPHLLHKNEVDVKSRSMRTDWPTAMEFVNALISQFQDRVSEARASDPVVCAHTSQAFETAARIFVQQNFKLWSSHAVMTWMYENLVALKEEAKDGELKIVAPLSPAMMRYAKADPADYEDKFQTMPADANPFDPNVVALAMNIDPNRRRLVQRNPRHPGGDFLDGNEFDFAPRDQYFAGPPNELIDPDLPLLEVFWRSALPWARVEGVPPPNR